MTAPLTLETAEERALYRRCVAALLHEYEPEKARALADDEVRAYRERCTPSECTCLDSGAYHVDPPPCPVHGERDDAEPSDALAFNCEGLGCPECGAESLFGYILRDGGGQHMHTRYVCARWESGAESRCGWSGWAVPGWYGSTPEPSDAEPSVTTATGCECNAGVIWHTRYAGSCTACGSRWTREPTPSSETRDPRPPASPELEARVTVAVEAKRGPRIKIGPHVDVEALAERIAGELLGLAYLDHADSLNGVTNVIGARLVEALGDTPDDTPDESPPPGNREPSGGAPTGPGCPPEWRHDSVSKIIGPGGRVVEFVHPHGQAAYFSCIDPDGEQADIDIDAMVYMVSRLGGSCIQGSADAAIRSSVREHLRVEPGRNLAGLIDEALAQLVDGRSKLDADKDWGARVTELAEELAAECDAKDAVLARLEALTGAVESKALAELQHATGVKDLPEAVSIALRVWKATTGFPHPPTTPTLRTAALEAATAAKQLRKMVIEQDKVAEEFRGQRDAALARLELSEAGRVRAEKAEGRLEGVCEAQRVVKLALEALADSLQATHENGERPCAGVAATRVRRILAELYTPTE